MLKAIIISLGFYYKEIVQNVDKVIYSRVSIKLLFITEKSLK